jgi:DNA-directed RNA polymerase specialized sigma24 family protein
VAGEQRDAMEAAESGIERTAAFTSQVMPEIPVLSRVALSMTHNPADAEDLVQDTPIKRTVLARFGSE